MPGQSEAERLVSLQQRLQSLVAALSAANAPATPAEPPDRPPKPVALTLRLDASRYAKLNARGSVHAAALVSVDHRGGARRVFGEVTLPGQRPGLLPGRWTPQTIACSEATCPSSEY
jgi:hypothetical protein